MTLARYLGIWGVTFQAGGWSQGDHRVLQHEPAPEEARSPSCTPRPTPEAKQMRPETSFPRAKGWGRYRVWKSLQGSLGSVVFQTEALRGRVTVGPGTFLGSFYVFYARG